MIRVHGYLGQVSEELRADVAQADIVVGGHRQLEALGVGQDRRIELGPLAPAIEALSSVGAQGRAVVVASGDPLYFGIVRSLRRSGLQCEVIAAPSSIQAAFAAVALPWDDAQVVNAHSRGIDTAVRICRSHPKVAVLTAPDRGIVQLVRGLADRQKWFVVAEQLGEAGERVRVLSTHEAAALDERDVRDPHVVLVLDHRPDSPQAIGQVPELAGEPWTRGPGERQPGTDVAPDGTDREPIVGQVVNSTRARAAADHIDAALGIASRRYDGPAARGLVAAWHECDLIVSHLALGATTRLIAPLLADKMTDPGVVVVDGAGHFAIPLVGGHVGGANELARRIGEALGATAVVSTATDSLGVPALDQLGWAFDGDVGAVTSAILEGEPVQLDRQRLWPLPPLPANVAPDSARPVAKIRVTDEVADPHSGTLPTVVLHPPSLVVGMGCNKGTETDALRELLETTLAEHHLALGSVAQLVSADVKAGERGLIRLARQLGVDYRTFPAELLDAQSVPTPSSLVKAQVGTASVAEASVLASGAELVVAKRKSAQATCAIGRIPARGRLHVVGLGPGSRDLLSPRAERAIRRANLVVGYGPYVHQIRDLVSPHAEVLATKMGTEEQRTQAAIDAARKGLDVAFVCGGDPAIYAMASPTLEMGTEGVDVDIIPGITAELAVSAILGAPLGHDHATISLSDLHTDWDVILERVRAAARGDFVITLYNPRSRTRRHHLPDALAIIAHYRGPGTPVAAVAQAERARQSVQLSTLGTFEPASVDMNTLVVVGSSTTKFVTSGGGRTLLVTPRDYHWMSGHGQEQEADHA
ncbi:precorrin-3B C17-methyltransferase/precorrin-6y C5,15-methyltransferase (decarboxylating), CbiE subunit [Propionibacterium cyclohexanicum]|uniref:Precorrin-3B C17-methyltransferase/precorrin-6y C5,15-methyltransferase (Decarboxylating), CbiE subunit n=1 Tax=Propionibacterium cyclohexanicum TaxID=64702 RepID=A0A1H9QCF2_9ACTN|nr:precorrin-3B C17-methyltransferase/precorrin-6y C5,15-methyltransferase (decarboxylating), CbiE subunit [Propionibacterium cyclohexanicum]